MATVAELNKAYNKYSSQTDKINQMYDAQKQSGLNQLEAA